MCGYVDHKITQAGMVCISCRLCPPTGYSGVKRHILPDTGPLRKDAYFQVWEALYRWRAKKDSQSYDFKIENK